MKRYFINLAIFLLVAAIAAIYFAAGYWLIPSGKYFYAGVAVVVGLALFAVIPVIATTKHGFPR